MHYWFNPRFRNESLGQPSYFKFTSILPGTSVYNVFNNYTFLLNKYTNYKVCGKYNMTLMDKDGNPTACKYLYHKKPSECPWAQNFGAETKNLLGKLFFASHRVLLDFNDFDLVN